MFTRAPSSCGSKGPCELTAMQGIIDDGHPHFHAVFSDLEKTYSGHLEEGSVVLCMAELVLVELTGVALERCKNQYDSPCCGRKRLNNLAANREPDCKVIRQKMSVDFPQGKRYSFFYYSSDSYTSPGCRTGYRPPSSGCLPEQLWHYYP
ncbi:MAG: DUF296 domain-containing protein [Negativicutes bacterium]|nr:DUF296 domain-containing protein [Negativicutes bacterium]